MNNKEVLEIKSLKEKKKDIMKILMNIRKILIYKKSFKYQESIDALNKIEEYRSCKCKEYKDIEEQIKEIAQKLSKNCNHSIIIGETLENECPFCKTTYEYDVPNTSKYFIEKLNYDEEIDNIDKIVLDSKNEEVATERLLNYFNELQYSKDVKIKRLIK